MVLFGPNDVTNPSIAFFAAAWSWDIFSRLSQRSPSSVPCFSLSYSASRSRWVARRLWYTGIYSQHNFGPSFIPIPVVLSGKLWCHCFYSAVSSLYRILLRGAWLRNFLNVQLVNCTLLFVVTTFGTPNLAILRLQRYQLSPCRKPVDLYFVLPSHHSLWTSEDVTFFWAFSWSSCTLICPL